MAARLKKRKKCGGAASKRQVKPWAFYYCLFSSHIYCPKTFGPTFISNFIRIKFMKISSLKDPFSSNTLISMP